MTANPDEQETAELLAFAADRVTPGPVPLTAVRAEAGRRSRRARARLTAAVAVLVVVGVTVTVTAVDQGVHGSRRTTAVPPPTPTASGSATVGQSSPPPTSDPGTIEQLQGAWTLHLTNVAPDGQGSTGRFPDVTITFRGDQFDTTDGVHAIEGHLTVGPHPAAGDVGDLSTYAIATASAAPAGKENVAPPPVIETLEALAHYSRDGSTFLLHAANSAIVAVLTPVEAVTGPHVVGSPGAVAR